MKKLILCATLVVLTANVFADEDDCKYLQGTHAWTITDPKTPTVVGNCSYDYTLAHNFFDPHRKVDVMHIDLSEGTNPASGAACPDYSKNITIDYKSCHPLHDLDLFVGANGEQGSFYKNDNSLSIKNIDGYISIISAKLQG